MLGGAESHLQQHASDNHGIDKAADQIDTRAGKGLVSRDLGGGGGDESLLDGVSCPFEKDFADACITVSDFWVVTH